jgi:hypothetical protein
LGKPKIFFLYFCRGHNVNKSNVFWRLKTSRIILTTISTITWSLLSFPMEFRTNSSHPTVGNMIYRGVCWSNLGKKIPWALGEAQNFRFECLLWR